MQVLLFFDCIITIACFKWRWLAQIYLYTETAAHFALVFLPHIYIAVVSPF